MVLSFFRCLGSFGMAVLLLVHLVPVSLAQTSATSTTTSPPATTSPSTTSPTSTATSATKPAATSTATPTPTAATPLPTATPATSTSVDDQTRKNQQDNLRNNQSYLKDLRREVSDITRDTKTLDVSKVNGLFAQYEACLNKQQGMIGTQDFWNAQRDCDDMSRSIQDEMQDNIRPQRECGNQRRGFEDRKKEKKNNVDRQLKDILRNNKNADVSALNALVSKITDAFSKADQLLVKPCSQDSTDDLKDLQGELSDDFQEWYTAANEIGQKANDQRQIEEGKKDYEKNIKRQCEKDIPVQVKQFQKDVERAQKNGPLPDETKKAYDGLQQNFQDLCSVKTKAIEAALQSGSWQDFNDARNDFYNASRDLNDSMNETRGFVNQQQQAGDVLREIGNREKELERMKKDVERAQKAGSLPSGTQDILSKMQGILDQAKKDAVSDPQSWWQGAQQDYMDLQNQLQQGTQNVQRARDMKRWYKDLEQMIGYHENDIKNLKRDAHVDQTLLPTLEKMIDDMKIELQAAKTGLDANDADTAEEHLRNLDQLRMEWDDTSRSIQEGQQRFFTLDQVKREVEHAIGEIKRMLANGDITADVATQCLNFANSVMDKVKSAQASGAEFDASTLDKDAQVACPVADKIGPAPGPDRDYYRQFVQNNAGFDDQTGDFAAGVLEKISQDAIQKVLQRLLSDPSVLQTLFQAAGDKYKNAIAGSLEGVTGFYDSATQNDLLGKKAQILDLNQKLEDLQKKVQIAQDKLSELQKIQDEIAGYNFYGSSSDDLQNDIENFLAEANSKGVSKEQIRKKIDDLRAKKDQAIATSKQAKFDAKIIPFTDTDDNDWFTKFAASVKQRGWVTGTGTSGGKDFNPGGLTNVAEAIALFARIQGIDENATPSSKLGQKVPDWAQAAAGTLEASGVDLDGIFGGKSPGSNVSRAEIAILLKQVLKLSDADPSTADAFSDMKLANDEEKAAIASVSSAGIMTGQGGDGPKVFDVKGPLTRAALAKVLDLASANSPAPPSSSESPSSSEGNTSGNSGN